MRSGSTLLRSIRAANPRIAQRRRTGDLATTRTRQGGLAALVVALAAMDIALSALLPDSARAQAGRALLQIEVRDSVGLPLPDAALEVFTLPDRAISWEWVRVEAEALPEGVHLIRVSHPGYRTSVFSIPLRTGGSVALRVNLSPAGDSATRARPPRADEVRATGVAIQGRMRTDVIGARRVLARDANTASESATLGALLRRAEGTGLNMVPAAGGTFRAYSEAQRGGRRCPTPVMVNADRRRVLAIEAAERLFGPEDFEVIEIFPRGGSVPFAYQVPQSTCGVIILWLRNS